MTAADPTYPLYPIAQMLSVAMLLLVLASGAIRRNQNLGVTFLCFWLFLEGLSGAINTIVWSDNHEIKLYVYCDIVSHVQVITSIVKPMATLIITRRLHHIANLQTMELPSRRTKRWYLVVDWTLGLIIPMLVAGPIYYVSQDARFAIVEGIGCSSTTVISASEVLMYESWTVIPPLASIIFYYPKVVRTCLKQRRDIDSLFSSSYSVSHTNYTRILVLASVDVVLTLPIGIANMVLTVLSAPSSPYGLTFYPGWTAVHANWEPIGHSYAQMQALGMAAVAQTYFALWSSPVLAFTMFGLFGLTPEARSSYRSIIRPLGRSWMRDSSCQRSSSIAELNFAQHDGRPRSTAPALDIEIGLSPMGFVDAVFNASHKASPVSGQVSCETSSADAISMGSSGSEGRYHEEISG